MIELKRITADPFGILEILRKRDPSINLDELLRLEAERKGLQTKYEGARQEVNRISEEISTKRRGNKSGDFSELITRSRQVNLEAGGLYTILEGVSKSIETELLKLPNLILPEVPVSMRKEDKDIVHSYGEKPIFNFKPLDHVTLGERLDILDFERGAKIAESGFPIYKGKGAVLEWSLINFMIDRAVDSGYDFMLLPLLNNTRSLVTTGNLPKFAEELYSCQRDDLHLIPTAETPLTNLHRDEILDVSKLPKRMASYSPCFRREAGSGGKMSRGLMRIHQFNKLETYSICLPENASEEHQRLINNGESILKDLNLHFRLANLPSCDLAQQSAQTFDIEIWLPVLGQYSEVSSASNCLDYQARRANIKYRRGDQKDYTYTLNCSALATPRIMISLLESNQTESGHVVVPEALRRYTRFDKI